MSSSTLTVRVQPRAGRNEVAGERGGAVLVRVTAPPADGKANDAVRKLIAKRLRIAPGRVELIRGARSRDKVLRIEGMEAAEVRQGLGLG